jgi:uncharacterized membrane protein YhaH (DUF805 family)
MNCPQCGGDLADQTFCPHCGAQAAADADVNPYAIGSQVQPDVVVRDVDALEIPNFSRALTICLREKYFSLQGRASRSEFWFFFLMVLVVDLVLFLLFLASPIFLLVAVIFRLYVFLPLLGATIRRYHDAGVPVGVFLAVYFAVPLLITFDIDLESHELLPIIGYILYMIPFLLSVNGGVAYVAVTAVALFGLSSPIQRAAVAGLVLVNLCALLWPGTRGPNKHGPAPRKRPKERRETQ